MAFYIFYVISLLLLVAIVLKLNNYHLIDESLTFFLLTNYILNISTLIFFSYFENYLFSLISIIALLIFAIFLIKDFRRIIGYTPLKSIPYFLVIIFVLVKIFILFCQTI